MPEGEYSGRLAFGDDDFHHDPDGERVVSDDGGKTWRYAVEGDQSHFQRYHERFVVVDSTANQLADLALEHGRERAEGLLRGEQPHHFDDVAVNISQLPDEVAERATGHTGSEPL